MLKKRACDLTVEDRAYYLRQSDFGHCLSEDLLARLAEIRTRQLEERYEAT